MSVARESASVGSKSQADESPFGPPRRGLRGVLRVAGFGLVLAVAVGIEAAGFSASNSARRIASAQSSSLMILSPAVGA